MVPALAGAFLVLVLVSPALAHADLESSDPADKAVVSTPPTIVTLRFSEDLDPGKSSFRLIGPSGTIGTGKVAGDPTGMTLDGLTLLPGDYEIQWTSAALDGDILRGTLTFTVAEPTPAPATPTPSPSLPDEPTAVPSAAPSVAPTPVPSAAPADPASSSSDVLLPIIVALVAVAAIGAYVLRRSRRA